MRDSTPDRLERRDSNGAGVTVSICMIVRDEEKYLGDALESFKPIADEVIVVDTGSTDRTVEIARAHGAKVFHHTWSHDFSIARNVSLSLASCHWIFVVDADEGLDEQEHSNFRNLTRDQTVCWAFTTRNYTNDVTISNFTATKTDRLGRGRKYAGYFEGTKVRLFPNDPSIRFEGRVHELVEPAIRKLPKYRILKTDIRIDHYGHTPEAQLDKDARRAHEYVMAGEAKIQDNPAQWQSYFELGLEYARQRLYQQSLKTFERALELNPTSSELLTNVGYVLCELERYLDARQTLEKALSINPEDHEAYGNLGVVFIRMENYPMAAQALTRAVQIAPQSVNGYCNLAKALLRMGKIHEAITAYDRALDVYPGYASAKIELGTILVFLKRLDRAEELFLSVVQDDSQNVAALYHLGLIYRSSNRASEALRIFERFLQVSPSGPLKDRVERIYDALKEDSQHDTRPTEQR
jgi:tetratricopeptide (TPR) repeat protein